MYEFVGTTDWRSSTVHDLAHWKNGLAFKNIDFSDSGRPVIKIAELKNGVTAQTARTMAEYDASVFVQAGDMLFSWSGNPDTSIDVFRWEGEEGWLNQHIFKVTPKKGISDEFLFFILRWLRPRFAEIARNKQTTGLGHVTIQDLKRMMVGVPDPKEQKAIVNVIGPLQNKIDLNRKMNETLEAMTRSIFKDWFVDFGPTRAKMESREPYHSPDIWSLFPNRLDDEGKPEGWHSILLSQCCTAIFSGGTPATSEPSYWGGNIPWLSSGETRNLVVTTTTRTITEAGVENSSTRLAKEWNTVIASAGQGNTRGQTSLLARDMYINQSVIALSANHGVTTDTLLFLDVSRRYDHLRQISDSNSSRGSLTTKMVASLRTVFGPLRLMQIADQYIRPFFERIIANEIESRTLAATRDLLLPKLMSGELSIKGIKDAGKTVGNTT